MSDNEGTGQEMTQAELQDMISGVVREVIAEEVKEAVEPLQQQSTNFMAEILTSRKATNGPETDPRKKGIGAARFVRAMAFGRGDMERAKHFADKAWDDDLGDRVSKALQAGDLTAGGALVPPEFADEIIELLRERSVIRAAGARILPMNNGTLTIRKQTGKSTTTYVGESTNIAATEPTIGQIVMTSKKLAAVVPISNDLLTFAPGDTADAFVRDDLVMSIATREDQAFIRDDGTEDKPKGLRFWALAANVSATAGATAALVETDLKAMMNDLEGADVRMINPVYFMSPRSKNHLIMLRDASSGELILPEIRGSPPRILGLPVFTSNNIPNNLGAGTESEVYLVDMADAIIGEATGLEIAVDSSASYIDSGTLVSAFTRDETLIRAISRHDFAVRHEESIAVKTGILWI